jgi:hypothetical protein
MLAEQIRPFHHLANHQASASPNGIRRQQRIPDSPRQCPGVGTRYFTIPGVAGAPLRKEFQQLDLGPYESGISAM